MTILQLAVVILVAVALIILVLTALEWSYKSGRHSGFVEGEKNERSIWERSHPQIVKRLTRRDYPNHGGE